MEETIHPALRLRVENENRLTAGILMDFFLSKKETRQKSIYIFGPSDLGRGTRTGPVFMPPFAINNFEGRTYKWPKGPRPDIPAHSTTFWPGPSTARPDGGRARVGPARHRAVPGPLHQHVGSARHDGPAYYMDILYAVDERGM